MSKINLIKAMHTVISSLNCESAYIQWIIIVPDEPQEDDFDFISHVSEEYSCVRRLFERLMGDYATDGFYTSDRTALLSAMDVIVHALEHIRGLTQWTCCVPLEATEADFARIANDDGWYNICLEYFVEIMDECLYEGFKSELM